MTRSRPTIGLIPAAGFARRLPGVRGSKELLTIPPGQPVITRTLAAMARAGISRVVVVIRPGKEDLVESLGAGTAWGVHITWVETPPTPGPAHTLDRAYEVVKESNVALAFPDILMEAQDPFSILLESWNPLRHDAVLGLFPSSPLQPADPVELDDTGRILHIRNKDEPSDSPWCWGLAVWNPALSLRIHEAVSAYDPEREGEWAIGAVVDRAIRAGASAIGIPVGTTPFLDIGTPTRLAWALRGLVSPPPGPSNAPDEGSD